MQNTGKSTDILMVEDNEADIVLMREALKDANAENVLYVVKDGEAAIAFLHGDTSVNPSKVMPGLVLLDLYLPKLNGMEVLATIKEDNVLRKIPVVMMSSSREEEDVIRAYDLQANSYVIKPVDFNQLLNVAKTIENFWLSTAQLPPSSYGHSGK